MTEPRRRDVAPGGLPGRPLEIEGAHCEAYTNCQEGEPSTALSADAVMLDRFATTVPGGTAPSAAMV